MSVKVLNLEDAKTLPKVELHAHLNGSIHSHTLRLLLEQRSSCEEKLRGQVEQLVRGERQQMTYDQIFLKFNILHQLVDNEAAVALATSEVLSDFRKDNVRYLELRSTPKLTSRLDRRTYVTTMMKAMNRTSVEQGITARALLSIDRKNNLSVAMETVELATEFRDQGVVGVDLSGHPQAGDLSQFLPALEEARRRGLKLAVHLAEHPGMVKETEQILALVPPDRIGHGVFLTESVQAQQVVRDRRIPIEACLTSNLLGEVVPNVESHPVRDWYRDKQPFCICTDDSGVFQTTSSAEHALAAQLCNMTSRQLYDVSRGALRHAFVEPQVKEFLYRHWNEWLTAQAGD